MFGLKRKKPSIASVWADSLRNADRREKRLVFSTSYVINGRFAHISKAIGSF